MRSRTVIVRVVAVAIGLGLGTVGLVPPLAAAAAATCSFDEPSAEIQISLTAGTPAVLARQGNAITLDGVPCGAAVVGNTDRIAVSGSGAGQPDDFTVDLSGGPFAPGVEPEPGGPEIEISVDLPGGGLVHVRGSPGTDAITFGQNGANLNADEPTGDSDLTLESEGSFTVSGREGADLLSVAGGDGTGAAITDIPVKGGAGADTLAGAAGGSTLDGGGGRDTVDYSAASRVRADLSQGVAKPLVDPLQPAIVDTITKVENLVGSPGDDVLIGNSSANELRGAGGKDVLDGRKGKDTLDGGAGRDTANFGRATKPVTVDLEKGTATGFGTDALSSIEDVKGSDRADVIRGNGDRNLLKGGNGKDEIHGQAGRDDVIGGLGGDLLFGGAGRDTLKGWKGRDQLDGGSGRDLCVPGPDPDAWTNCEKVKL